MHDFNFYHQWVWFHGCLSFIASHLGYGTKKSSSSWTSNPDHYSSTDIVVVMGRKSQFLMIFGGSSVTAGHDNHFHQSYPMVFHRRMKEVFDALGIELFVRNIAQGQNQCRPSDLCYEAMGGSGPSEF